MKNSSFIQMLREIADLYEQNPEILTPQYVSMNQYSCSKEQLAAIARAVPKADKRYSGDTFVLEIPFEDPNPEDPRWPDNITLRFYGERSEICTKRVVGKKQIPEEYIPGRLVEAHEEEIVEWECHSSLLAPPKETEA